jgi:PAS domain S-box-containing protein
MDPRSALATLAPSRWTPRSVLWVGGLFIAVFSALAAWDIVRGYHAAVSEAGRRLESQARVIAEQAGRSVQAVDVVLRGLVEQFDAGVLASLGPAPLRAYLQEQSAGLVQIDGLVVLEADGTVRASSHLSPVAEERLNLPGLAAFQSLRSARGGALLLGGAMRSEVDGKWVFPLARRLQSEPGRFAGAVAARGRIEYFQDFYRDLHLDRGTTVTLMQEDGRLLARFPPRDTAPGRHLPRFGDLRAAYDAGRPEPMRAVSPVDGVERFGAIHAVPGYPLAVVVAQDVPVVLAPWRAQALGSAVRTLALGGLAALLLAVVRQQILRLQAARESLDVSRERFELAVAGSSDGILDWDIVNDRMFTSERAMRIAGVAPGPTVRTRAEWVAMLRIHPDDHAAFEREWQRHLDGLTDVRDGEHRVQHPDGVYRWVRVRGTCVRDAQGRPVRFAGSVSDIDAQKRAEQALRQSEERFQLAVAGANQGLWDWDLATDTVFLSPRAQAMVGLVPGEPQRPRREWIARIERHPDDAAALRNAISAHLRGATEYYRIELRLRHPTGWRWYRERGVALRDESARPFRMAGSIEDITDAKNADAERARLETQLRQAQKLEAIGTLAGGIAHDFNNILAAILGYGELAQKDAADGTRLKRHIDAALAAGLRAKSLVERILAFSRGGVGERAPVHVQAVVAEALDGVAASLPPGIRLQRHLDAGRAGVLGDPTQVHQVVMNLCANAIQAMKVGGTLAVALEVRRMEASVVATSSLAAGDYLCLQVTDTGTGIPPQVRERMFDPFFTTREVGVGTGLGLSLVHGIVTDLGGGIDIESCPGAGSRFTVYLPWTCSAAASVVVEAHVPGGAGETILLVDDEEALVRLGEEMIAELGYEPVGFTSSVAALDTFRAEPSRFHAVLSDEAMPELTGSELAREMLRIRPDIPVVLMSGYIAGGLASRARSAGVRDVLAKPLVARDIARSLAGVLRQ